MNPRFFARNMTKPGSIKFLILNCMCGYLPYGSGWQSAKLQASEDNMDYPDASFQNAAQAQHAHNVAIQATLQDPKVAKAIACAKKSGDPRFIKRARASFHEKMEENIEKISDMRSSGMGWGNIAKQLNVHPSFLGGGHSKYMAKHDLDFPKNTRIRSEIKAATARSFKGQANKGRAAGGSNSKHKSLALTPAKGRGSSNGRGLALEHSKSNDDSSTVGQTTGHGNGHGNGHGFGHAAGNGGGKGGGNK